MVIVATTVTAGQKLARIKRRRPLGPATSVAGNRSVADGGLFAAQLVRKRLPGLVDGGLDRYRVDPLVQTARGACSGAAFSSSLRSGRMV